MTKTFYLNVSDIPSFIGENVWDFVTPFEKLWKKYDKDYNVSIQTTFDKETLTVIEDKTKSLIEKKKILKHELKITNEILEKATSAINTTHGIQHEQSAIDMFEQNFNTKLDTNQTYYKFLLKDDSKEQWYIGGKMDGIQKDDKYIVEVKNRTSKFFNKLRDYENTQVQLYLELIGFDNAKLVEKYKDKIKVIDVTKDSQCIQRIKKNVFIFIDGFSRFLQNTELKQEFESSSFEMKKIFLKNLYINKIYEFEQDKMKSEQECLL
jgi:hypothetical protein